MTTNARIRPVSGRWFEELPVGFTVEHVTRRTVTETDNVLFTTMTMNPAPMHLDADYASRSEFGRPLVNSMFTVALVVGLSVPELTLGTIVAQLGMTDISFPARAWRTGCWPTPGPSACRPTACSPGWAASTAGRWP